MHFPHVCWRAAAGIMQVFGHLRLAVVQANFPHTCALMGPLASPGVHCPLHQPHPSASAQERHDVRLVHSSRAFVVVFANGVVPKKDAYGVGLPTLSAWRPVIRIPRPPLQLPVCTPSVIDVMAPMSHRCTIVVESCRLRLNARAEWPYVPNRYREIFAAVFVVWGMAESSVPNILRWGLDFAPWLFRTEIVLGAAI